MGAKMIVRGERMPVGEDPVEDEVSGMISSALTEAREVLYSHRSLLELLANTLLEEETVSKARILELASEVDPGLIESRKAAKEH